jgi:phenylalanyl-tRNA synthetase beta chain
MKVPLSWIKDFVDITLPVEEVARILTMAGLEVEEILMVGLPALSKEALAGLHASWSKVSDVMVTGLAWDADKIVVAQINEVMPHPNADRLVLCRLYDGSSELSVLTGAPNLFPYKGQGALAEPLKVAYAREGARIYDGHQPGQVLTTLKRTKIRGVESFSMVCSEKELGISDEHEGVIILDADAPTGMPLVEYMGDAVLDINLLPNLARDANVLGVARELAALTGQPLRLPPTRFDFTGEPAVGKAHIQIQNPELNPRFVLGLVSGVSIGPSPYRVQRRLRLAGMRPINAVVDATNYVMLEVGEPLHAFDYDVLLQRTGGKAPTIITRTGLPGERLTTLDGADRAIDPFTVLVCDTAGSLSIAGVMGGAESEVSEKTRNILLEGASWNYINIRRTVAAQKLQSEAAYRFSRGVHPALAPWGVQLGLDYMSRWAGGVISKGVVDSYPAPVEDACPSVSVRDVRRVLGIELSAVQIAAYLSRLEFACRVEGETVFAQTPPHRLDIDEGVVGRHDLLEEIARLYGYDHIPETHLQDVLPEQMRDLSLEGEEQVRDLLVKMGLQEVISQRLTEPSRERRIYPSSDLQPEPDYVRLINPITPERSVMRTSLLASVLDALEHNARLCERLALFEIGPVFWNKPEQDLPDEPAHLAIALTGLRLEPAWDTHSTARLDFYDLKGVIEGLLEGLHIAGAVYRPAANPSFHPGKCAEVCLGELVLGVFGELHPLVKVNYDFGDSPVLAAEFDLESILQHLDTGYATLPVPVYPPVLEDIAVIVDEAVPAAQVEAVIRQASGKLLAGVRLFDIFRGAQIGEGKKSLAYSLTYQAADRTLTDGDAAQLRQRIVRQLERELGARLRS